MEYPLHFPLGESRDHGGVMLLSLVFAAALLAGQQEASAQSACAALDGAKIVTEDGEYLGNVAGRFDLNSVYNKFGTHGSKFSVNSIWNQFGNYGSKFSNQSARSKHASSPPFLIKNQQVIGRLTQNRSLPGAVDPLLLGVVCFDFEADD